MLTRDFKEGEKQNSSSAENLLLINLFQDSEFRCNSSFGHRRRLSPLDSLRLRWCLCFQTLQKGSDNEAVRLFSDV